MQSSQLGSGGMAWQGVWRDRGRGVVGGDEAWISESAGQLTVGEWLRGKAVEGQG